MVLFVVLKAHGRGAVLSGARVGEMKVSARSELTTLEDHVSV